MQSFTEVLVISEVLVFTEVLVFLLHTEIDHCEVSHKTKLCMRLFAFRLDSLTKSKSWAVALIYRYYAELLASHDGFMVSMR